MRSSYLPTETVLLSLFLTRNGVPDSGQVVTAKILSRDGSIILPDTVLVEADDQPGLYLKDWSPGEFVGLFEVVYKARNHYATESLRIVSDGASGAQVLSGEVVVNEIAGSIDTPSEMIGEIEFTEISGEISVAQALDGAISQPNTDGELESSEVDGTIGNI